MSGDASLTGSGTMDFQAAPPEGGTVPGAYVLNLLELDGGDARSISGTFYAVYLGAR